MCLFELWNLPDVCPIVGLKDHMVALFLVFKGTSKLFSMGFPSGSDGKESAYNARDPGSTSGPGRSPGEENGNPLQYSFLENPMDRGAWRDTVLGVAKSGT